MPGLPQLAFLLSIAGLSVSLAGFAGLVAALKRGSALRVIDAYRLRQIPEMALPTGFLALVALALADSTRSPSLTIQIAGGAGLLFTMAHAIILRQRGRAMNVRFTATNVVVAIVSDLATIAAGVATLVAPTAAAYEWLLTLMIARPGLVFLLALSDVSVN